MISRKKVSPRRRRQWSIRKKISGTAAKPRMVVFRSAKNISVQFIDDVAGTTLASASSTGKDNAINGSNVAGATEVGKLAAEAAKAAGISTVVFDRAGFKFHGRIEAVATAAREAGLVF